MTELVRDERVVGATPDEIRTIVRDPAAIRRLLPEAESLQAVGPGQFRAVLATRVKLFTVRADAEAQIVDVDPPRLLRLEIVGRPRGFGGSFAVTVPFELEAIGDPAGQAPGVAPAAPRTRVRYSVDLAVTGAAASFAGPGLANAVPGLVADLVRSIEAEAQRRRT
ncbi:MAG: CoxG family protein [Chloroflexota bacterium]